MALHTGKTQICFHHSDIELLRLYQTSRLSRFMLFKRSLFQQSKMTDKELEKNYSYVFVT